MKKYYTIYTISLNCYYDYDNNLTNIPKNAAVYSNIEKAELALDNILRHDSWAYIEEINDLNEFHSMENTW